MIKSKMWFFDITKNGFGVGLYQEVDSNNNLINDCYLGDNYNHRFIQSQSIEDLEDFVKLCSLIHKNKKEILTNAKL